MWSTISKWVVRVAVTVGIGLIVYGAVTADGSVIGLGIKGLGGAAVWHWTEPMIARQSRSHTAGQLEKSVDK